MPLVLGSHTSAPDIVDEPYAWLYPEVCEYLLSLRDTDFADVLRWVRGIASADPYGRLRFPASDALRLEEEAKRLGGLARQRGELPEPPASVGVEELGDPGERFGWSGLAGLARALESVGACERSKTAGLLLVGD